MLSIYYIEKNTLLKSIRDSPTQKEVDRNQQLLFKSSPILFTATYTMIPSPVSLN